MKSIKLPIKLSDGDKQLIAELQAQQSPMIRSAYKQSAAGCTEISVRAHLRTTFTDQLDSWFQQSAAKLGMGMFKADTELGVKSRIFGGRQNWIRRSKGLISKAEWKQYRLQSLYLIGESPQHGNRKFDFSYDSVRFKPQRGTSIVIDLPDLKPNLLRWWHAAVDAARAKLIPITVSLTPEYIVLTFDETKVSKQYKPKPIKNRYAGIDLNPNYIGISVFDGTKLVDTKLFSLEQLTGKHASPDKLQHETREIGHAIGKWLQHMRVDYLFVEQLNFKSGSASKGKNFNRLVKNQWKRETLKQILVKYFKLYEINAAYTSTIGNVLNPALPDPIAASTAIAQRGNELVIKKSKKFYPELPTQEYLDDLWKETEIFVGSSWKELHDSIKNSKVRYRVPIPEREGFRNFQSRRSYVGVL